DQETSSTVGPFQWCRGQSWHSQRAIADVGSYPRAARGAPRPHSAAASSPVACRTAQITRPAG
ncbi:MAG TPA: hypothetical protein VK162_20235, partial [Streptosporangiaceae bacterium]|nr:hypothetical protein [Streptosporangiaceae bacterium]